MLQFQWALENGFDFSKHYPDRFVYLSRSDVVAQAISYIRALQTKAWTHHTPECVEPCFSANRIHRAVNELIQENHDWETLFGSLKIKPHRMSYEVLCADMEGETTRMLQYMGVNPAQIDIAGAVRGATTYIRVQRDEITAEWRQRYLEYTRENAERQSQQMGNARVGGGPANAGPCPVTAAS